MIRTASAFAAIALVLTGVVCAPDNPDSSGPPVIPPPPPVAAPRPGVTCGELDLVFSTPPVVTQGTFSFAAADGVVAILGRIVSDRHAVGTVDALACPGTRWNAVKK